MLAYITARLIAQLLLQVHEPTPLPGGVYHVNHVVSTLISPILSIEAPREAHC